MTDKKNETNKENHDPLLNSNHGGTYEICVRGQLDESWSDWLEGLEVKLIENDKMILKGQIRDQAALMGVLNRLYGLNLTLLSLSKINQKNEATLNK